MRYLEDKELNDVLEEYFESLNEAGSINYYEKFKEYMKKKEYDSARYYLNKIDNKSEKQKAIDEFNNVRKSAKPYNESLIINTVSKVIKSLDNNKYTKYLEKCRNKDFPNLNIDLSNIHLICKVEKIKINNIEDNEPRDYYISITYMEDNIDQDIRFATNDYIKKPITDALLKLGQFISFAFGDGDEGSFGIYDENYDQKKWYE